MRTDNAGLSVIIGSGLLQE